MAAHDPAIRAAICVVGLLHRISPDKEGLMHVARALGAEVFAVLTGDPSDEVPQHLKELAVDVQVYPDPGREGLQREAAEIDPSGAAVRAVRGMLFAHPLSVPADAKDIGTGVFQSRDMSLCFRRVRQREQARGALYEHIVYARADAYWLMTLPDMRLLRSVHPEAVWIPDGCDSDGINDRMAIVPRRWAPYYFDRYHLLLNGTLTRLIKTAMGGDRSSRGDEWLLYVVLRGFGVPVRRFSPVAALTCVGEKKPLHASCTRTMAIGGDRVRFRYAQEASEALQAVGWMSRGWAWRPARAPWVQPPCFPTTNEASECCNERMNGWGGRSTCWNDVYYFWRCCGQFSGQEAWDSHDSIAVWKWGSKAAPSPGGRPAPHGVWVLPTRETARAHAEASREPVCYRIAEVASRCFDPEELASMEAAPAPPPTFMRVVTRETVAGIP